MTERIQKLLATAGIASRREIERLIGEGRILVNGRPAELGQKVDHDDKIRVDGRQIGLQRKSDPTRVLIYKKRVGEVVTREDPEGRRTVFRKLPVLQASRWIAVGRLDINTSGLLLLTNNGELARRLMHPSFEISREYAVRVHGHVDADLIQRLTTGVELDDGMARFESMRAETHEDGEGSNQWFVVRLREGRNREVRRLFESQGLEVSRLIRVRYGPIELGRGIKSSSSREATALEVEALMEAVGLVPEHAPARPRGAATPARKAAARSTRPVREPSHESGRKSATRKMVARKADSDDAGRAPAKSATRKPAARKADGRKADGRKADGRKPEARKSAGRKPPAKPTGRSR